MKRFIALTTTAIMAFSSAGVTVLASPFADIHTVPWVGAAKFIDEAASLGLMKGYPENGKKYCKPRNNVTYCEAVQLVYSIMKTYYNEDVHPATVDKWKHIITAYKIPTWAHEATAYALDKGILVTNDLAKFMNGKSQRNANREDVGVMFGKALGKVYSVNTNSSLPYKDAASINKASVPYLDLLYTKKIMVGDDNNKFNPKVNINRAEMAVLSVKSYRSLEANTPQPQPQPQPQVPASGTVSGTVNSATILSDGQLFISLYTPGNTGMNLFVPTAVAPVYQGKSVALSDVQRGDAITVAYNGNQVKSLNIDTSKNGITSSKSFDEIKRLTSSKITVKSGSSESSYYLADKTTVTIDGSSSSVGKLSDYIDSGKIYSAKLKLDSKNYVTAIEATESNRNPKTGVLTNLTSSNITIKVSSKSYDYRLSDGDIKITGDSNMTFSKLKREYEDSKFNVTLTLDGNNKVTEIKINSTDDAENGTLTFINSHRMEMKSNGKTLQYNLNRDVEVIIDGKSSDLSKLRENYEDVSYRVSLKLDRDDYVTRITATKERESVSTGTLYYMGSSYLKIRDSKKEEYRYDLLRNVDDIDVTINGRNSSYSALRDRYQDNTYEVELSFKNGEVSRIKATNVENTKGDLRDIDTKNKTITLRIDGRNKTYDLDLDADVRIDGKSSSLSTLKRDYDNGYDFVVSLSLNSRDCVIKIDAEEIRSGGSSSGKTVSGRIDGMFDSGIRVDGEKYSYGNSDPTVTIDGRDKSLKQLRQYFDDKDEFKVTLKLNSRNEVTEIKATTL